MKCDICKKESKWEGHISYTLEMPEIYLCRSHYIKWNKYHKPFVDKHNHIKPCTKSWERMCDEEARLFMLWFKKEGGKK